MLLFETLIYLQSHWKMIPIRRSRGEDHRRGGEHHPQVQSASFDRKTYSSRVVASFLVPILTSVSPQQSAPSEEKRRRGDMRNKLEINNIAHHNLTRPINISTDGKSGIKIYFYEFEYSLQINSQLILVLGHTRPSSSSSGCRCEY